MFIRKVPMRSAYINRRMEGGCEPPWLHMPGLLAQGALQTIDKRRVL
jgi:hypothetical protein